MQSQILKFSKMIKEHSSKSNRSPENGEKSSHILSVSANLLGLCIIVLTSIKAMDIGSKTYLDELTAISVAMFMFSCVFSFMSIWRYSKDSERYEKIAEIIFMLGLFSLFATTMLLTFKIIK